MTWYTDKRFQVVTITQKKNSPEKNFRNRSGLE